jgi:hypothetical protein
MLVRAGVRPVAHRDERGGDRVAFPARTRSRSGSPVAPGQRIKHRVCGPGSGCAGPSGLGFERSTHRGLLAHLEPQVEHPVALDDHMGIL